MKSLKTPRALWATSLAVGSSSFSRRQMSCFSLTYTLSSAFPAA